LVEVHIYEEKAAKKRKPKGIVLAANTALRLEYFRRDTSILEVKRQLALRYSPALLNAQEIQINDDLANKTMSLFCEDLKPMVQKGNYKKNSNCCDFCGGRHSIQQVVKLGERNSYCLD